MSGQTFLASLQKRFGDAITGGNFEAIDPWIEVSPEGLVDVCTYLRDEASLRFNLLNCITVVDYFEPDPKKAAKAGFDPHLELVYHLWSIPNKTSLVVKVMLPRWKDDVPGELPEVATVSGIWSTADWHEREVFDLSGVRFLGHPNPRRILCPEDWVGHPLRKDYEMPLDYHGIRAR
ncbi:MAG TPA: NADH-quinone oxidoreductase subunit C [Pirellulales bacterium]|jgi:NADH-quinone oxidoreductase subunit C